MFQNTHSIFFLSNKIPALIEVVLYLGKDYLQTYLVARHNHVIKYNEREAHLSANQRPPAKLKGKEMQRLIYGALVVCGARPFHLSAKEVSGWGGSRREVARTWMRFPGCCGSRNC